jgi:hypothetical protein
MASNTQNPSPANASAKTEAAPKPAAAKTTRAKQSPRAQTTRGQASRATANAAENTAATAEAANGTSGATTETSKANGASATSANAGKSAPTAAASAKEATAKAKAPKASVTADAAGRTVTVNIPITVDQLVAATMTVAKLPTSVARRVVSTKNGLPVYLGIGGLAVIGAAEWPVAAAAGVGYAALRRWGPLRRETAPAAGSAEKLKSAPRSTKKSAPVAEQVTIDDDAASAS